MTTTDEQRWSVWGHVDNATEWFRMSSGMTREDAEDVARRTTREAQSQTHDGRVYAAFPDGVTPGHGEEWLPEIARAAAHSIVPAKAMRYIEEGRVRVTLVEAVGDHPTAVEALVRGSKDAPYFVTMGAHTGHTFSCNCQARGVCSHMLAVALVTVGPEDLPR